MREYKTGSRGDDPDLQGQKRVEGISGKQGTGGNKYYDDIV